MDILHLSDLHFGTEINAKNWTSQLASDLKYELACSRLDLLIISGDIANRATPEEYRAAASFVKQIMSQFGLSAEHVIIVPGNHDVDWGVAKGSYDIVRREDFVGDVNDNRIIHGGGYIEIRNETKYRERFRHFSDFCALVKGSAYPMDFENQAQTAIFVDQKLLILGLNSAWALDHHYTDRASIHAESLSNALDIILDKLSEYGDYQKYAVWHHPIHSSSPDRIREADFLQRLAVAGFSVCFHGHIHKSDHSLYRYDHSYSGRKIELISAGTFGAPTREWIPGYPLQYNFIRVSDNEMTVFTRARREVNGTWKPDAIWTQGAGKDPKSNYRIELPRLDSQKKKEKITNILPASIEEKITEVIRSETPTGIRSYLPPKPVVSLIDRTAEMQDLQSSLQGKNHLVAVTGAAGLGKTALAVEMAHIAVNEDMFEEIVYVTAKQQEFIITPEESYVDHRSSKITTFDDVLNEIGHRTRNPVADLSTSVKEERIISLLDERKCLIIIDNFDSLRDQKNTIHFLRYRIPHNSKFLITSRCFPGMGNVINLKGMEIDDGVEFLRSYADAFELKNPLAGKKDVLVDIVKWSGGVPLIMKLIISRFDQQFTRSKLNQILTEDLQDEEMLWFCYNGLYRRLSLGEKYVLQVIALLPSPVSRSFLTHTTGLVSGFINEAVGNLIRKSLLDTITVDEKLYYSVLPATKSYVRKQEFESLDELWRKAVEYYTETIPTNKEDHKFLEREFDNIIFTLEWCISNQCDNEIVRLFMGISQYLDIRGMNNKRLAFAEIAVSSAHKIGLTYDGYWIQVFDIAWIHQRSKKDGTAFARNIYTSLIDQLQGSTDIGAIRVLALCYRNLALMKAGEAKQTGLENSDMDALTKQQYNEAFSLATRSLEYWVQANDEHMIAITRGILGGISKYTVGYDQALQEYNEALNLDTKNGNLMGVALWLSNIGKVYIQLAKFDMAIEFLDKAIDKCIELRWLSGLSYSIQYKGHISKEMGNFEQAKHFLDKAANIEFKTGSMKHYHQIVSDIESLAKERLVS